MVTNLFTGIGYIPTNTQLRGVDVTINGDGHYAGVDVYGPPQRLATNKIHLSVVGIQQATPNWVVMPGE